ncbi:MAG: hypothetical protein ABW321_25625 [Polyangiales bacterium]
MQTRWIGVGWCVLVACASDPVAPPAPVCERQAIVRESAERWQTLVAEHGNTYRYVELNCVVNQADGGNETAVRVRDGVAELEGTSQSERDACLVYIDRYVSFRPQTFEQLHDACEALLERGCDEVELDVDEQGVLQTCSYRPETNCHSCGEGFYVQRWEWSDSD